MVNVLIALNTRMQLPMCNIANVLLLMLMLLKQSYMVDGYIFICACSIPMEVTVLYNGKCIIDMMLCVCIIEYV